MIAGQAVQALLRSGLEAGNEFTYLIKPTQVTHEVESRDGAGVRATRMGDAGKHLTVFLKGEMMSDTAIMAYEHLTLAV